MALTKFGRCLHYVENYMNSTVEKWTATDKFWGKVFVVLVEQYKMAKHITFRKEEIAELLPKRTAKKQFNR